MTIPASQIVSVTPGVLLPGGLGIVLNGLALTNGARVPIGTVAQFPTAAAAASYFGPDSTEASVAANYFAGFNNSTTKPGNMLFAQYNASAVGAFLRGGNVTTLSLAQLQALSGSLTVIIDGYTHSAASINLSSATSYSSAASIIQSALFASEPQEASFTATISTTTMTVSAVASGTIAVGQTVTGTDVTADSVIVAQVSGTAGGVGVYTLSQSSTVGSGETMTASATAGTVSFDSVSGGFIVASGITGTPSTIAYATGTIAASIFLTQTTGAVISQGAAAATPSGFMTSIVSSVSQNWATFFTTFDPDDGGGNAVKLEFATWNGLQNNRFMYVAWDYDASPTTQVPASECLAYLLQQADINGTFPAYRTAALADGPIWAAFISGMVASINFNQLNGRITLAYKSQSGLPLDVGDATVAANLLANGYNFYGAWATATTRFIGVDNGQVSPLGSGFLWADTYVNQIWLNANIQNALMNLIFTANSLPYNQAGYSLIIASIQPWMTAALNAGVCSKGVQLSQTQIAELIAEAGFDISPTLYTQGFFIQVLDASASVRQARGSPPINVWYTDGGSVQKINVASIVVE
jgi:hypothetical protein